MADHGHNESQGGMSCCEQGSCATHDHDVAIHDHSHGHGLSVTIQYCSGWGYARYATALSAFLLDEFGTKVKISSGPYPGGRSGAFEVTVGDQLVHSKLTMSGKGHGKCETDQELDAIIDAIKAKVGA
jgi:selT/selW/selH-like putative selenoprotein